MSDESTIELANPKDADLFRIGDRIVLDPHHSWWKRVWYWLCRRKPEPVWRVDRIRHDIGVIVVGCGVSDE